MKWSHAKYQNNCILPQKHRHTLPLIPFPLIVISWDKWAPFSQKKNFKNFKKFQIYHFFTFSVSGFSSHFVLLLTNLAGQFPFIAIASYYPFINESELKIRMRKSPHDYEMDYLVVCISISQMTFANELNFLSENHMLIKNVVYSSKKI